MDYIKPPTDNLYKFVSIAGMILVVLSVAFPFRFWHDVELQRFELDGKIMAFRAELDYWRDRSKDLKSEVDAVQTRLLALPKKEDRDDAAKTMHLELTNKVQELLTEFDQRSVEIGRIQAIQEAKDNELKYLNSLARFFTLVSVVSICTGLFLSALGFFLWYTRFQRLQDQIVRKQAEKSNSS